MKLRIIFFIMAICIAFMIRCSGVNTKDELNKSSIQYFKPQASTKLIKGEKVNFELWVDKHKWEIYDSEDTVFKDFKNMLGHQGTGLSHVLRHNSGESMAIIQQIPTPADFEILHETLSESLSIGRGSIVSEDIRGVNGRDILYIKWIEDLGNSKIVWLSYYLSNTSGHMRLAGGTTEDLLADYESDLIDLLNGLVDSNMEIQPKINAEEASEKKLSELNSVLKKGLTTQEDHDQNNIQLTNLEQ